MNRTPIIDALIKYRNEGNAPFSMPGHKSARGFLQSNIGRELYNIFINGDITEVEGLDNFHNPEGIIKESQELLSDLYGSEKSFFLVNGSTSGNLVMIFSTFNEGDKIIVERNCHRSILNGIIMRKLKPIYLKTILSKNFNAPISYDMEHFLELINCHKDIKGIFITYPNYYGIASNIKRVITECKKKRIKVLVDCAHGAHFGITEELPENPIKLGAHMVVMSAHKTLPSLTQTAFLHIGNDIDNEKVKFYLSAFSSTSPSYMFLASMEYARYYLETSGKEAFQNCIFQVDKFRKKINKINGFKALDEEDIIREYPNGELKFDRTRLIINVGKDINAFKVLEYMKNCGVQCEMSDGFNLILICSPFNSEEDYEKVLRALKNCDLNKYRENKKVIVLNGIAKAVLSPYEVIEKKGEKIDFEEAEGRISAVNIVPYPPGVPLIMMGEIIDRQAVDMIQYYLKNEVSILGIENRLIKVLEKEL